MPAALPLGFIFSAANIIMAALGGIMIPRFLMLEFMHTLSWFTPMSWGLEGFHDLCLSGEALRDVAPECSVLRVFAVIMPTLAIIDDRGEQEN